MGIYTMRCFFQLLFVAVLVHGSEAQLENRYTGDEGPFPWPDDYRGALSLTFDDGRTSQVDVGMAVLNEYDIKATFYVTPMNVEHRIDAWKAAVRNGHEIGNHTTTHPCTGNFAFSRRNPLEDYDLDRMERDIQNADERLAELLGVHPTSFAYPCGQTFVGRGRSLKSYIPLIATMFVSGRLWLSETPNDPWFCDLAQLTGMESDAKTFEQLRAMVDQAAEEGRWLILAGHDIGEHGRQTTTVESLRALFEYLSESSNPMWIAPVGTIADHVHSVRNENAP